MELDLLIGQLESITPDSGLLSTVASPKKLVAALRELSAMVEMDRIKKALAQQVKHLLVGSLTGRSENEMLHCLIHGPPGVGKTSVARVLAKIWTAMGLIRRPGSKEKESSSLEDLQNKLFACKQKLKRAALESQKQQDTTLALRKKIQKAMLMTKNRKCSGRALHQELEEAARLSALARRGLSSLRLTAEPEKETMETDETIFVVAKREDFVGKYVGHTAPKTRALLESALGGVLFIDEAYSLITGGEDSNDFGMEALTVLNEFMSLHAGEILVVFAGYKDLMEKTIFRAQPGLKRRCAWAFEAESYSAKGLAAILQKQLARGGWSLDSGASQDLVDFFQKNKKDFPFQGGDTERLAFHAKLAYSSHCFSQALLGQLEKEPLITKPMLEVALKSLRENKFNREESPPPLYMFT